MWLYYKHRVELYRFLGYQEQCGECHKHRVELYRFLGYKEQCGECYKHRVDLHRFLGLINIGRWYFWVY